MDQVAQRILYGVRPGGDRGAASGSRTASTDVFRLPKGFRPPLNHAWSVAANGGVEDVDVFSNGFVFAFGPATAAVALDGISFRTH